jgi:quinol monooxygenase YgiN
MEKQIQVRVELTVINGKADELKAQIPAIIELVKANELDIIAYQWYLSDDQTKCFILERFTNPQAWLIHLTNVEPALPALFAVAPLTRFEAFGDIPREVEDAVKPLGAVIYRNMGGFIRPSE